MSFGDWDRIPKPGRRTHTFTIEEPVFESKSITSITFEGPDHSGRLSIIVEFHESTSGEYIQRVLDALKEMNKE
jgi:hypothetical protein